MKKNIALLIVFIAALAAIYVSVYSKKADTATKDFSPGTVTYVTSKNLNGSVFALIMETHNSSISEIAKSLSEIYQVDIFLEPSIPMEPVQTKLGATSLNLLLDQLLPPLKLTYYKIFEDVFIIPEDIAENLSPMEVSMPQSTLNESLQAKISKLAPESSISIENGTLKIKCSPMHFNQIQDLVNK